MSDVCVFPYPSSFWEREDPSSLTGVRLNLPQEVLWIAEGMPTLDTTPTNTADGCSPAGPILLHMALDVDATQLNGQHDLERSLAPGNPLALFDLETGEKVMFMSEMDMNRSPDYPGRYALIIRPLQPMEMGHRHVAVLTQELRDAEGNPFISPEAFRVLRDGVRTTNDVVEDLRPRYEEIFAFLEDEGYPTEELLLAWDFMVASGDYLTGSVRSMREAALADIAAHGVGYQLDSVETDPNEHTARLVQGTFEVVTYLNEDSEFEYDAQHHPIRQAQKQSFPFAMIIPRKARTQGQPLPLVVFGHGLFGSGQDYLAGWGFDHFSALAEEVGVIVVGTDWIGMSTGDLDLMIQEVIPDLNRSTLITDRLQQSLINNLTLTELAVNELSVDPALTFDSTPLVDSDRVYYYGVSLGGIQGASLVSLSPRFERAVLAVPGSGWLNMLTRSVHWNLIAYVIESHYPDPLLRQVVLALIQSRFDLSDPVNLTRHLYRSPLPDAPAERVVLLQESIGDSQVPNLTTEMLARAIGARLMQPAITDVPGLETVTSPTREPTLVQYYLPDQVEANPPPETNVPPESDNGVHSDILFLDHVLAQVFHFLLEGEIEQYCSGSCDPD